MARQTQDRNWQVDGDPFLVNDEEAVVQTINEAMLILTRIGGAVIIVAQREEVAPDMWQTTGYAVRWSSYAPGARLKTVDDEPVGEPVAAANA